MTIRLSAGAFLAGLVAGTIALSILGSSIRPAHLIDEFKRFHVAFNNRHFSATGRELEAIVDAIDTTKTVVVVGGSSVLQGATQAGALVWTNELQKQLGSDFYVLNVAQRAGQSEDSNFVAEMLLKKKRPVIYVCDAGADQFLRVPELSPYQLAVYDGWRRGYMLDWEPRDSYMRRGLWSSVSQVSVAAWGSLLDRYLNFRDLWNYVEFEKLGTTWNDLDQTGSFTPLRHMPDPEPTPDWIRLNLPNRNAFSERDLKLLKHSALPATEATWAEVSADANRYFPTQLRAVTMIIIDLYNHTFLDGLTIEEKNQYFTLAFQMKQNLEDENFRKILVPEIDFTGDDFNDRVHLSVDGGKKLAKIVAPEIASMAKELNYGR